MNMQDPISDMLTQVRNAQAVGKKTVSFMASKIKVAIVEVLKEEGFISDYSIEGDNKKILILTLKYYTGNPVISHISRVSCPSLRVYKNKKELPNVMNGMGIAIMSTSGGVMTSDQARSLNIGGEVLCYVY